MVPSRRLLLLLPLVFVLIGCGGGSDNAAAEQSSSRSSDVDASTPERPPASDAESSNASDDPDMVRTAIEGTTTTQTIDGVSKTIVWEVGDIVYSANGRYQFVQAHGYDGPPVWASQTVDQGILHEQVSNVSIPVIPAVRDEWRASFAHLGDTGEVSFGGDTYVLVNDGDDLGLDPAPAVSFEQAVQDHGRLEQQWSGPLTEEVICHYAPNEHLRAVVPGELLGDIMRWKPQVAQHGCSLLLPRADGMGAVTINAYDVNDDADHFGQEAEGFPGSYFEYFFLDRVGSAQDIEGLGTQARLWSSADLQHLQVRDENSLFVVIGPGPQHLDDEVLVNVARVLLARFSASTRVDQPREPLSADAMAEVQSWMTERAELQTAIASGDVQKEQLFPLYEHLDDAWRAIGNASEGTTFSSIVLRAYERRGTSMGDVIEVYHCSIESRTSSSGTLKPDSDTVEVVRWSVETGRIIDERGRHYFGGSWCAPLSLSLDFTEADLRAAMGVDATEPDSIAANIPETQRCVVERSFADLGFEQLVEWGVTPEDPQIQTLFRSFSDEEAQTLARITTDCGVAAAAMWVGATGETPPNWDALQCFTDRVGAEAIIELVVSQIQQQPEPTTVLGAIEPAIAACS